jgi:menaquinone-specific isochorismate synthase
MPLRLSTIALDVAELSLLAHLPANPLAYIRGGDGLVGWGEAVRLEAHGPSRIQELSAQWQALAALAEVDDQVKLPGTGLVAFGSIAFADSSETSSALIVPKVLLGLRDGRAWLTTIELDTDGHSVDVSGAGKFWETPTPCVSNTPVALQSGAQSSSAFKTSVEKAVTAITDGGLEKVVLARDLVGELPADFDIRASLNKLANRFPTCWIYSVDGLFGASPELLVRVAHGQVSARVLAGTAGRGTDPEVDKAISAALAASAKNTTEHAFAVDSLVQTLAPFCAHVDADPKPFSLALPNLWHLASDVHGVLREEASVLDIAAALHPTAAVAGTPRLQAQQLLAELEPFDRGRYAGPVGWIGADGDGEWAIALRGAQIEAGAEGGLRSIRAFAGCGIVAGSDPDAELAETELKFSPIREALS